MPDEKGSTVYLIYLAAQEQTSLPAQIQIAPIKAAKSVRLLGSSTAVQWKVTPEGLSVSVPQSVRTAAVRARLGFRDRWWTHRIASGPLAFASIRRYLKANGVGMGPMNHLHSSLWEMSYDENRDCGRWARRGRGCQAHQRQRRRSRSLLGSEPCLPYIRPKVVLLAFGRADSRRHRTMRPRPW